MTVVICHCRHRGLVDPQRLRRLQQAVHAASHRLVEIGDLCAAAAHGDVRLAAALAEEDAVLCGCHGRALRALALRLAGRPLPGLRLLDLRDAAAGDAVAGLGLLPGPADPEAAAPDLPAAADAWFPVIDAERCVHCAQCLSFCLFGVYARAADGAIQVREPLHCKTDCPACARVCPENAIVFPKSTDEAINGAARTPEQLRGARIRLRPDEVFGGDLRAKLAARRAAAAAPLFRPGVFAPPPDQRGADAGGRHG